MADMRETNELAYFAGFFDGESCVGIYPGKYVAGMANTDLRPLRRAQELWGGSICGPQGGPNRVRDIYRWELYGRAAVPFLEAIRPFIRLKGEQIDTYLEVLPYVPVGRGSRRTPGATEVIDLAAARLKALKRGEAA